MIEVKIDGMEIAKEIVSIETTRMDFDNIVQKLDKSLFKVGDVITINDNPKPYQVKSYKRLKNGFEQYTIEIVKDKENG